MRGYLRQLIDCSNDELASILLTTPSLLVCRWISLYAREPDTRAEALATQREILLDMELPPPYSANET